MFPSFFSVSRGDHDSERMLTYSTAAISGEHAKSIIYVAFSECDDTANLLKSEGWSVDFCRGFAEAICLHQRRQHSVGILDIKAFLDDGAHNWNHLYNCNPQCQWIGLVDRDFLENNELRYLIARDFFDFQTKPIQIKQFLPVLGHACGMSTLRRTLAACDADATYAGLIGTSRLMQELFANIRKLEHVDVPVLVLGESGTGKELIARAIHQHSPKKQGPFIAVNCGAVPETLIQSELFGHEKGAFTGAHSKKIGKIEAASDGTVFLDEIGDLLLSTQTHLLRFLQEKTMERVGSCTTMRLNARVVAATHVDLESAVEQGRFRQDLYHRLDVLRLTVPPLRERGKDIELLANHFYNKYQHERRPHITGFTPEAIRAMYNYHWPGNVRELINRVRHALIMSENRLITPADLRFDKPETANFGSQGLTSVKAAAERQMLETLLRNEGISITEAALRMGVSRATLYRLIGKHDLRRQ